MVVSSSINSSTLGVSESSVKFRLPDDSAIEYSAINTVIVNRGGV